MKIRVPLYLLLSIFIALFQVPGSLVGETIFFKQPSSTSSSSSLIHSLMPFTGVLYCIGLFINPVGKYFPKATKCEAWTREKFLEHAYNKGLGEEYHSTFSSEEQRKILDEHHLYWNKNYWEFVETFSEYESYILSLHRKLDSSYLFGRAACWVFSDYQMGFQDIVAKKAAFFFVV